MSSPQSVGGKARARALGPARRSAIARKAAKVRWSGKGRTLSLTAIRTLARALAKAATRHATVYLFGSYARGQATPHSDVDLLVVERGLHDWLAETVHLQRVARARVDKEVDLIVMGAQDWQKWRAHFGTVQHAVDTEGLRLAG